MASVKKAPYSRPIPEGAEILSRGDKRFARFRHRGRVIDAPLTKDGRKCLIETAEWYIRYKNCDGYWQRKKGYTDRQATEALAVRIEKGISRQQEGLTDPFEDHHRRPLAEHLADFHSVLAARWCAKHVKGVVGRASHVIEGCGFKRIGDVQASRVQVFLGEMKGDGYSVQTCNHHLRAVKQFCRWLVKDRRTGDNPLAHLETSNAEVERRRVRRALSAEEVERLLVAALHSRRIYAGLAGADRFVLYYVALGSGLRVSEVASLTPESFHLDSDPPMVVVEAGTSKRRRRDEQPLQPDLVNILIDYLAEKPPGCRLWPGSWSKRAAEMLRIDLEAAGIPYLSQAGEYADFHAQRQTYITVAAKHLPPKMAQALARHSTPMLTERYTHTELQDTGAAAAQLPPFLPAGRAEVYELRATGTDDNRSLEPRQSLHSSTGVNKGMDKSTHSFDQTRLKSVLTGNCLPPACQESGTAGHKQAQLGAEGPLDKARDDSPRPIKLQGFDTARHGGAQTRMGARVVYAGSLENC